jgi:hypothetical protein
LAVSGENRTIAHAQLTWGNGMMMLGSVRDNDYGKRIKRSSNPMKSAVSRPRSPTSL